MITLADGTPSFIVEYNKKCNEATAQFLKSNYGRVVTNYFDKYRNEWVQEIKSNYRRNKRRRQRSGHL